LVGKHRPAGRGGALDREPYFARDTTEDPEAPPLNYQAVRTDRYLYAQYGTGEQELYDLQADPFELQNAQANPAYASVKSSLQKLLGIDASCAGRSCLSRPALKLKLSFGGGGCVSSGVRARVVGRDAGQALDAVFYAGNRKAASDVSAPLSGRIGSGRLSGSHRNRITALVDVLDGRKTSVSRSAPARC